MPNVVIIQRFVAFRHDVICSNELLGDWELLSLERTQENQMVLPRTGLCIYYFKIHEIKPSVYFDITAEHRCLAAKYSLCEQAEDAGVSRDYLFGRDCLLMLPLQDATYCSFCSGQNDNATSIHNIVLSVSNTLCKEHIPELGFSFYI